VLSSDNVMIQEQEDKGSKKCRSERGEVGLREGKGKCTKGRGKESRFKGKINRWCQHIKL